MSDRNAARRTEFSVRFSGVDITEALSEYLISLSYIDQEEGETDDLTLRLQDRGRNWLLHWLDSAAAAASSTGAATGGLYQVTAGSGLRVRKGRGTNTAILGALPCGTVVTVSDLLDGWATIQYGGGVGYLSFAYLAPLTAPAAAGRGMSIQATITRHNWAGDGLDEGLDTGLFELDSLTCEGPPGTVILKATSLPFTASIRQTRKSRAWEKYDLRGIAAELAGQNGLACLYLTDRNPYYARAEQYQLSDIAFLDQLCRDAGCDLKTTNRAVVIYDQTAYEGKTPVRSVIWGDGSYTDYSLDMGTAEVQYAACRVYYNDPATGKSIEATAVCEDYDSAKTANQTLSVARKVRSVGEARELAAKLLRQHNRFARTVRFSMPGDPRLLAGETIAVSGFGSWDGKYIIRRARHTVGPSGYTTVVEGRWCLEGYA